MRKATPFIATAIIVGAIATAATIDVKQEEKRQQRIQAQVDSTKVATHRDTVLVLDYKPKTGSAYSHIHTANKSGQFYEWLQRGNIPVERGDEIIIDVHDNTYPDGNTRQTYDFVKNLTTEKMAQEYINMR